MWHIWKHKWKTDDLNKTENKYTLMATYTQWMCIYKISIQNTVSNFERVIHELFSLRYKMVEDRDKFVIVGRAGILEVTIR